jgi:competence protein ComEC
VRRLLPALALAQAAGVVAADRGWLGAAAALALGGSTCALACAIASGPRRCAALALVAAFAAGALSLGLELEAADAARPARRIERSIEATVRAIVPAGPALTRVELDAVAGTEPGAAALPRRIQLWLPLDPALPPGLEAALPGERIRARVLLAAPAAPRNPGARDAALRARRAGVGAVGRLVHPSLHVRLPEREGWRPLASLHEGRARAAERLAQLGPGGDLLRTLALGQAGALGASTREACAALGVSHLLSVSGLHLSLVAALGFGASRRALRRSARLCARWDTRRPALALALLSAGAYAVLAGAGVPVRRALVLLVALAVAAIARRPGAAANSLAAASIAILAFEPGALFDPGAQLSFAGSAALAAAIGRDHRGDAHRVMHVLTAGLRVSATALLATAPIAAAHFGRSAPFALLANALAVPWTGAILLPASITAAALALCPEHRVVEATLVGLAWLGEQSLRALSGLAGVLPLPQGGATPGPAWLLASAALALAGLRAQSTGWRVLAASALGVVLAFAPPARVDPALPRVVFVDVGQGDATLVQSADAVVLVDAGGSFGTGPDPGQATVVPTLRALGVRRIDLFVVSHGDLDHRGGAPAVLRSLEVGELWLPFGAGGDASFAALRDAARAARVRVVERGEGSPPWVRGDLAAIPLWPRRGSASLSRNDRSLVVRVEVAGRRVLLPGDLEADGEAALLAAQADLRAEVLKLPHHGSRSSSTRAFLAAVGATVAISSAPCEGRFDMPHAEVVQRAHAHGLSLWWTGRDGAVRIGLGPRLHVLGTGPPRRCAPRRSIAQAGSGATPVSVQAQHAPGEAEHGGHEHRADQTLAAGDREPDAELRPEGEARAEDQRRRPCDLPLQREYRERGGGERRDHRDLDRVRMHQVVTGVHEGEDQRDPDTGLDRAAVDAESEEDHRGRNATEAGSRQRRARATKRGDEEQEHHRAEEALEGGILHARDCAGADQRAREHRREHRQQGAQLEPPARAEPPGCDERLDQHPDAIGAVCNRPRQPEQHEERNREQGAAAGERVHDPREETPREQGEYRRRAQVQDARSSTGDDSSAGVRRPGLPS